MKEMASNQINLIETDPDNIGKKSLYCILDTKSNGFQEKKAWYQKQHKNGLRLVTAEDEKGKQLGFIEYAPAEHAWRPVAAVNFLFIHCIMVKSKKDRASGVGNALIGYCEKAARDLKKAGVCTFTSNGSWLADSKIFKQRGYQVSDTKGRFELMYFPFDKATPKPKINNWEENLDEYQGWNIVYSNQCPWHDSCLTALVGIAMDEGIELKLKEIKTPEEAKKAPSGFGTFALIKDGVLLEDHYISGTRFKNILKKI